MNKKKFKESMINWKEWNKFTKYLDKLAGMKKKSNKTKIYAFWK